MRTRTAPPSGEASATSALDRHCRRDRVRGAAEHHEDRVPLGIDLAALMRGKRGPQQGAVDSQYLWVSVPKVHRQEGAVLDVSVEHREGAAG